jgi:hypothetical protein
MEAHQPEDAPVPLLATPAVTVEPTPPPPVAHRDRPHVPQPMRASQISMDVLAPAASTSLVCYELSWS